jgi:hypothetical protein
LEARLNQYEQMTRSTLFCGGEEDEQMNLTSMAKIGISLNTLIEYCNQEWHLTTL